MTTEKKAFGEQRRREILEEVERSGRVTVVGLAERWGVWDMTIRRDLEELAENELLKKVHGARSRYARPTRSRTSHRSGS